MGKHSTTLAPEWLKKPSDLNALDHKVWPSSVRRNTDGELAIGGLSVDQLANSFGTPLYVIDQDDFMQRAAGVRDALKAAAAKIGTTAKVYYASKAFLCTEAVHWVRELDLNKIGRASCRERVSSPV